MGKKRLPKVQRNLNRKTYTDSFEKKYNIEVKFISFDQAKLHLRQENFIYKDSYNFKEDRYSLWKHKYSNLWVKLTSSLGYLSDTTMDMGTVWTIKTVK